METGHNAELSGKRFDLLVGFSEHLDCGSASSPLHLIYLRKRYGFEALAKNCTITKASSAKPMFLRQLIRKQVWVNLLPPPVFFHSLLYSTGNT